MLFFLNLGIRHLFLSNLTTARAVSEINGDFNQKSQIIPTPIYFASPLMGFR